MNLFEPDPLGPVTKPLEFHWVKGELVFIGAGAIGFSMTPQAAEETGRRLQAALRDLPVSPPDEGSRP